MISAAAGDVELCKKLQQNYPQLVRRTDNQGRTALRYAFDALKNTDDESAQDELIKIVDLLRPQEYALNSSDGVTTLMLAARENLLDIVQELKPEYAKAKDLEGRTALMYACEAGSLECVEELQESEVGMQDNLGRSACIHACAND